MQNDKLKKKDLKSIDIFLLSQNKWVNQALLGTRLREEEKKKEILCKYRVVHGDSVIFHFKNRNTNW